LTFAGTESEFISDVEDNGGLGSVHLGEAPLSGAGLGEFVSEKRFRYVDPIVGTDFYEMQVSYEMESLDASWRIVAHGGNVQQQRNSGNELIRVV
jgi:hypothetical protein